MLFPSKRLRAFTEEAGILGPLFGNAETVRSHLRKHVGHGLHGGSTRIALVRL
jgi:hypothetical protein